MTNEEKIADLADQPFANLENAPMPTPATLRHRRSLAAQFLKFVGFDLRIMRMVMKGHSQ